MKYGRLRKQRRRTGTSRHFSIWTELWCRCRRWRRDFLRCCVIDGSLELDVIAHGFGNRCGWFLAVSIRYCTRTRCIYGACEWMWKVVGQTFLSLSTWKMREKEKDEEAAKKRGKEGDRQECLSHCIRMQSNRWLGMWNVGT